MGLGELFDRWMDNYLRSKVIRIVEETAKVMGTTALAAMMHYKKDIYTNIEICYFALDLRPGFEIDDLNFVTHCGDYPFFKMAKGPFEITNDKTINDIVLMTLETEEFSRFPDDYQKFQLIGKNHIDIYFEKKKHLFTGHASILD